MICSHGHKAYSLDFRQKVIDAIELDGMPKSEGIEFGLSSDLTKLINAIKIDAVDPAIVNFPDIPENWYIAAIGNM